MINMGSTFISCLCGAFLTAAGFAQAQEPSDSVTPPAPRVKHFFFSPYFSYYTADSYKDKGGTTHVFDDNGRFHSENIQLYFAYKPTASLEFHSKLPFLVNALNNDTERKHSSGFGDWMLGANFQFWNAPSDQLGLTGNILVPLYSNTKVPYLGYQQFGTQLHLKSTGSHRYLPNHYFYYSAEAGWDHYYGNKVGAVNQFYYDLDAGFYFGRKNNHIFRIEANGILSGQSLDSTQQFTPLRLYYNTQFSYTKLSVYYGYAIHENLLLLIGAYHDVYNKNTSIGKGIILTSFIHL